MSKSPKIYEITLNKLSQLCTIGTTTVMVVFGLYFQAEHKAKNSTLQSYSSVVSNIQHNIIKSSIAGEKNSEPGLNDLSYLKTGLHACQNKKQSLVSGCIEEFTRQIRKAEHNEKQIEIQRCLEENLDQLTPWPFVNKIKLCLILSTKQRGARPCRNKQTFT